MLKTRQSKIISVAVGGLLLAAVAAGTSFAVANNGDDQPLTGATYDRAVEAALAHTGGGVVTETEVGDDGAAYEVEIRLDDGSQVEVELDDSFAVIGSGPDDDGMGADDDD
jgi:hypothetical protein